MANRFTRYTLASGVSTAISQVALFAFTRGGLPALVAGAAAFAVGSVPHFLIIRRWSHGTLPRQLTVYVTVTLVSGALSVGAVALVDVLIGPAITDQTTRTLALGVGYLLGGAPIFLAKFTALDRLLFTGASAYEKANSISVRAANPVAPGVMSS